MQGNRVKNKHGRNGLLVIKWWVQLTLRTLLLSDRC